MSDTNIEEANTNEPTVLETVQSLATDKTDNQNEGNNSEDVTDDDVNADDAAEEGNEDQPKGKKNWVEFTPEQQEKFNDLYKQAKMSDARNQMLMKMLEEQQKQLDEVKSRFSQTDQAEAEKILKARLQEARDEGDVDKEIQIFQELSELKKGPKAAPKEQPKADLPNDPDTRYVVALAQETDDNGQPLRPWLVDTHPRYKTMLTQATIAVAELEADGKVADVKTVMKILDERMNKKTNPRSPDPMGGNLTASKSSPTIKPKLSAQEKAIAAKLGMSEADYLDGKMNYGVKR